MKIVMAQGHMFVGKSSSSADYASMAQVRLLEMFHTDSTEYTVVFTTGLKASFRLVANAYPFRKGSPILVAQDNHDAVNQVLHPFSSLLPHKPIFREFKICQPPAKSTEIETDTCLLLSSSSVNCGIC